MAISAFIAGLLTTPIIGTNRAVLKDRFGDVLTSIFLESFQSHARGEMTPVELDFCEASKQGEVAEKKRLDDQQRFQLEHQKYKVRQREPLQAEPASRWF